MSTAPKSGNESRRAESIEAFSNGVVGDTQRSCEFRQGFRGSEQSEQSRAFVIAASRSRAPVEHRGLGASNSHREGDALIVEVEVGEPCFAQGGESGWNPAGECFDHIAVSGSDELADIDETSVSSRRERMYTEPVGTDSVEAAWVRESESCRRQPAFDSSGR